MSDDLFGQSNYGGNFIKKEYRKLKDGEAVYRILPALGYLKKKGTWSVYYSTHYGYKNSEGKMRLFESPLVMNFKTKMVEVPDAALERIQTLKAMFDQAKKEGNKDLIAKLDPLVGQKGQFNIDKNHHVNAIDLQGNVVILKLRYKAMQSLKQQIDILRDAGIDPLSADNGRFFVFRRSGMGLDTTFNVSVLKEKITTQEFGVVERDVVHVITKELSERLLTTKDGGETFQYKEVSELDKLYARPTSAEVARIVKEGPKAVDEIFDAKPSSGSTSGAVGGSQADDGSIDNEYGISTAPVAAAQQATVATVTTTTPVQQQVAAAPTPAAVVTQTVTPAPVAVAPAPATPSVVAPSSVDQVFASSQAQTPGKNLSDMNNEEFLASIGMN